MSNKSRRRIVWEFCDIDRKFIECLKEEFDRVVIGLQIDIRFADHSILDCRCDAYVSPANSYGIMDGGIDLVYSRAFQLLQEKVFKAVSGHGGLIPVGVAEVIRVPVSRFVDDPVSYLIVAPTMVIPEPVPNTINAYLAMRAAAKAVACHNTIAHPKDQINSIACPGLCTATGRMKHQNAARQMVHGLIHGSYPSGPFTCWNEIVPFHKNLTIH